MKNSKKITAFLVMLLAPFFFYNCSNDDNNSTLLTPSQVLASTPWETTGAKNQDGESVSLEDPNVINFVGFAYFDIDGTFTMFNLDDTPKMQGDWSVSPDGKTRTIVAKNDLGETLFTRIVDITVLTRNEFTYRIFPESNNPAIYFDIIHTPTQHTKPK